jgi:hypothetical protein
MKLIKTFVILFILGILVSCASFRENELPSDSTNHESNNK